MVDGPRVSPVTGSARDPTSTSGRISPTIEASTLAKVRSRILPFVFVLYIVAYLDRANVAFAKMHMMADLRFSEAVFGFGSGIFFIGYFLFEIPGALLVERWSARRLMARILVTWGICTVLVGFVRGPGEFYTARFLLGCAEAGFFPGIIIYLGHWFPRRERARAMAGFILAIPVCLVLGAPLSALILHIDWFGLAGWQWIFILQGLPAVILGFVTLSYLTDHPKDAKWLEPAEREWLAAELKTEQQQNVGARLPIRQALRQRNVMMLALTLCIANIGSYAFTFWLPSLIKRASDLSVSTSTALAALPFACGLLSVYLSGRSSDRKGERRLHTAVPMMFTGLFFAMSGVSGQAFPFVLFWLCLTGMAGYAWPPPFWLLPTASLGGAAAAASVGLINSIGNLGGFIGPTVVGLLLSNEYSHSVAIFFLASCYVLAGLLALSIRVPREANT
jgi:MFS transporter, ACS family, tartrate transporter